MRNRRGRFEGSIFERVRTRKDGSTYHRWCALETVQLDNGRTVRVTASAETKLQAIAKADEQKRIVKAKQGRPKVDKTLLSDFLLAWLQQKQRRVEATTFASYESHLRLHILPKVAKMRLATFARSDVAALLKQAEDAGASNRLLRAIYTVLNQAFGYAQDEELISINPCARIKRPTCVSARIRPLSKEQCDRLLDAAKGSRIEALLIVALQTGLRQGEILALQWSDLSGATLAIRRQVRDIRGKAEIVNRTKSGKDRQVHLSVHALGALQNHRRLMHAERQQRIAFGLPIVENNLDLIFTNTRGGLIEKRNFTRREFLPIVEKAGLPPMRFHDLRHSCATLLFQSNIHPKIVSEMLGHSSISMTLDTYSASIPSLGIVVADTMDRMFGKH